MFGIMIRKYIGRYYCWKINILVWSNTSTKNMSLTYPPVRAFPVNRISICLKPYAPSSSNSPNSPTQKRNNHTACYIPQNQPHANGLQHRPNSSTNYSPTTAWISHSFLTIQPSATSDLKSSYPINIKNKPSRTPRPSTVSSTRSITRDYLTTDSTIVYQYENAFILILILYIVILQIIT